MDKERFLDVNGFSTEYDIPLERRLNKYRKGRISDSSRGSIPTTERLQKQSDSWRSRTRRTQIITAIVATIAVAAVIALSIYLTYGM